MPRDTLDEREFELINIIGPKIGANQRDLSRQMALSLGMVNMLIRRLISKGFIRINQLNQRKVEYILTPKGFSEKMRKSVAYTMKTINSIGLIQTRLQDVFAEIISTGEKDFIIIGKSDFAVLVANTLRELSQELNSIEHLEELPEKKPNSTVLICKEEYSLGEKAKSVYGINLIEELAKDYPKFATK